MKQFKILKHPAGEVQAIKQGWCWPAFFFSFIWAILGKMWSLGFGVLGLMFGLGLIVGFSGAGEEGDVIINGVSFVVNIIFGINGNKWRENNLVSRGYEPKSTVTASNKEGAIALFINEDTATATE
jgi:hypothetical protein